MSTDLVNGYEWETRRFPTVMVALLNFKRHLFVS